MNNALEKTVRLLEDSRVDEWEVFSEDSSVFRVEMKDGHVDTLQKSKLSGLAVRVITDQRLGFSFTSALDEASLVATVRTAQAVANTMPRDPVRTFVNPKPLPELDGNLFHPSLLAMPESEKIDIARTLEECARREDSRISVIRSANYSDSINHISVVNSRGLSASAGSGMAGISIILMAESKGHQEMAYWMDQAREPQKLEAESVAARAAQRATQSLGGGGIASGRMPVIMENLVVAEFLGVLSRSFIAEHHHKNTASSRIRPGNQVFASCVSIVDDGRRIDGAEAFPFDGEGYPSSATSVARHGTVESLLYDTYYGAKAGATGTGNGRRARYDEPPSGGISNLFLEPGKTRFDDLVHSIDRGLLVTEVMGLHTANPVSGDFSVGTAGLLIEKGHAVRPVKGVTVAGNMLDVFAGVVDIADDFRFFDNVGAASILVDHLMISGH
jgi:PmbA protein